MKKRFLLPLLFLGVPLSIGIADAAMHQAACGLGHEGACETLSRRKLIGKEDNINDAKSCIKSNGALFAACNRVDAEYIPEDLKAQFAVADAKGADLAAKQEKENKAKREAALAKRQAAEAKRKAEIAARGEWSYSSYTDEATGKKAKTGSLISKNSMSFDFPYGGIQYGRFAVRNHPRYGVDAYLSIDKGQLLCDSYNNTTVLIRFDNGAASSYNCGEPADHSSETVFIKGVGRLEARMKTAKKMYVTVSVYGEGSRTWEFNVKGYDRTKI